MTILIRLACKPIRNLWRAMELVAACLLLAIKVMRASAQYQYPFQNPALRVELQPGERKTVEMLLPAKSLAFRDTDRHSYALESGRIELLAGSSSADIRLKKTITVDN